VRRQLETLGHDVLEAESAAAALALLKSSDEPPHVLLTDMQLGGGMNGVELAEAARREFQPALPVVFMSGFTAVPEAQNRINASGAALLGKPVTLSELDRALNQVTSGNPRDTSRS
jgi:CheY-like chemotaxis protein